MPNFSIPVDGRIVVEAENKDEALEKAKEMMYYGRADLVADDTGLVKKEEE